MCVRYTEQSICRSAAIETLSEIMWGKYLKNCKTGRRGGLLKINQSPNPPWSTERMFSRQQHDEWIAGWCHHQDGHSLCRSACLKKVHIRCHWITPLFSPRIFVETSLTSFSEDKLSWTESKNAEAKQMLTLSQINPIQPRSRWLSLKTLVCIRLYYPSDYIHEMQVSALFLHKPHITGCFLRFQTYCAMAAFCGDLSILTGTQMSMYSNSTAFWLWVLTPSMVLTTFYITAQIWSLFPPIYRLSLSLHDWWLKLCFPLFLYLIFLWLHPCRYVCVSVRLRQLV